MTHMRHSDDVLSTSSFDDPVPPGSEDSVMMDVEESKKFRQPHSVAGEVQRVLQRLPGVIVESLAVRELENGGVLLEGRVQATSHSPENLAESVRSATGISHVVDRLRVNRTSALDETCFDPPAMPHAKG